MSGVSTDTTVEVAVPTALRRTFHYAWPAALGFAVPGVRVHVPFARQQMVGYVIEVGSPPPPGVTLSPVSAVLDAPGLPTFTPALLSFIRWMADYYRAPLGEALRAAHPAGTNLTFSKALQLTEAGRAVVTLDTPLKRRGALALLQALKAGAQALDTLEPVPSDGLVKDVVDAGWAERLHLVVAPRVHVKTERCVQAVAPPPTDAGKRTKRDEVLSWLVGRGAVPVGDVRDVFPKAADALRQLIAEGRVSESLTEVLRDPFFGEAVLRDQAPRLSPQQRVAVDAVNAASGFKGFLLHGVTGSGKTEVYLHIIEHALAQGRGALVLVPEIALTPQLVRRFRARIGDAIAVLHSGLSDEARYDQWRRLRQGEVRVAIGARSAIFAPVPDLGLIVVDEEHDSSYKQGEGLRYHGRDMALLRGSRENAVVVLGSATPSLESTQNATLGKLRRLSLTERPTGGRLPEVHLIDLRRDKPPKDAAPFLSVPLRNALAETLGRGEQSILFLNRRGFSNFIQCRSCGHVLECDQCAVAMTWHRGPQLLRCHYCDAVRALPGGCPDCGQGELGLLGQGTERVEDALRTLFPQARVARLDRDTATGRGLRDVLDAVRTGKVDILVGTQMVTKGHDFPRVTLVGVLQADASLAFPDFRAGERTFQLLTQVAGRAGRGDRPGRVLIQTYNPEHPCLQAARLHDHAAFCVHDLELRRMMTYPPFGHATAIRLDARLPEQVEAVSRSLADALRSAMQGQPDVVLRGPAPAPLVRLRGRSRWAMLLTATRRESLRRVLDTCDPANHPRPADVRIVVDVDPQDFL